MIPVNTVQVTLLVGFAHVSGDDPGNVYSSVNVILFCPRKWENMSKLLQITNIEGKYNEGFINTW